MITKRLQIFSISPVSGAALIAAYILVHGAGALLQAQVPAQATVTAAFASTVVQAQSYVKYQEAVENAKKGNLMVKNTDATQGTAIGKTYDGTLTLPEAKNGQSFICLMTLVSDDGCNMTIDNTPEPWQKEYGKGHDISKGSRPWPGVFVSGKTYDIKIHYTQTWYKPGVNDLDGISVILCVLPVNLAVDANRDGEITYDEKDTTTQERPFRFWLNNDDDPYTLGEDVETAMKKDELSPPEFADWWSSPTLDHIDGVRDLEDFTRLHVRLPSAIVQRAKTGELQVGFKWANGSGPRIRVYKAQGGEGDERYLFYKYEANLQIDTDHLNSVLDVKGSQTTFLPNTYWQGVAAGTAKLNFIFEGCAKGAAKLTMVIKVGSSPEVEGAGVWIKLMDVQEMFERGKVAAPMAESDNVPDPWVTTEPLIFQSTTDPNGNGFQVDPDETKQYIIHVHGWRMTYAEAQTWANTTFKRLWHLGYKGRYAFFSWPTYSPATSALKGYLTYNKSEYRAWLSGAALKSYVASLPSGYTKNIMAHSMGNVVVGSAFRQGMGGISNYSLFNAAMAAQAYDPSRVDYPLDKRRILILTQLSQIGSASQASSVALQPK